MSRRGMDFVQELDWSQGTPPYPPYPIMYVSTLELMYICVCLCMYVCMHIFMYVCTYVCMCGCTVCMCICMYVCVYAYMYVCMHTIASLLFPSALHITMNICMYVYIYVCMHDTRTRVLPGTCWAARSIPSAARPAWWRSPAATRSDECTPESTPRSMARPHPTAATVREVEIRGG